MDTPRLFRWFLTGLLFLFAGAARADTVLLKDGTQFDGTIQSESDTEVQIEVSRANGTILETETIKKSDIAQIIRLTPAQRAEQEMQDAYRKTLNYQLDPQSSKPLSYYNQVIADVFQAFLTKYPGSPHENEIKERIAQWTKERDQVGSGMGRIGTEWLTADEFAKHHDESQARALLEKGGQLAGRGQFSAALEQFQTVLRITRQAPLADEASRRFAEVVKLWSDSLARVRENVNAQIKSTETSASQLHDQLTKTQSAAQGTGQTPSAGDIQRLGQDSAAFNARVQTANLRDAYDRAEANLAGLRQQLADLDIRISQVKTMTVSAGTFASGGETPTNKEAQVVVAAQPAVVTAHSLPPVETAGETPDVLVSVGKFFHDYWMYGLVGIVIILWAASHAFK